MEAGKTAQGTMDALTSADPDAAYRQVGIVDANGNAATFTGDNCYDWAGGVAGPNFAAQGNILVSEETVQAMAQTFQETKGNLAERLLKALDAGQDAGGDSRGIQSAALLIVKEKGGYAGFNDRFVDLRVDEHPDPIKELIRIYELQQLYFAPTKEENIVEIQGEVREELVSLLLKHGYLESTNVEDEFLYKALTTYIHTENFEGREQENGKIDLEVLTYMKK
jgi:uncharacterized Ntn-hydrolase superfamily protein